MVAYHQGGGNQSRVGENLTRIAVQPSTHQKETAIWRSLCLEYPAVLLRSRQSLLGPSAIVPDMRAIHPGQRLSFAAVGSTNNALPAELSQAVQSWTR